MKKDPITRCTKEHPGGPLLKIRSWNSFAPTSDEKLWEQIEKFAEDQKITVQFDTLDHRIIPELIEKQIQEQSGYDIDFLADEAPWFYRDHLYNVDDLVRDIQAEHGELYDFARDSTLVEGSWKAVPWFWFAFPGVYREDHFQEAGVSAPYNWEEVCEAGRVLRQKGHPHPVGIPVNTLLDTVDFMVAFFSILWGFGGKVLEKDGKTPALRSPATKNTLEFFKKLYENAMGKNERIFLWDESGNNQFLLSGRGSWILNPIGVCVDAFKERKEFADKLGVHSTPAGEDGKRYAYVQFRCLGIWKFSKNKELAKTLLRYLFQSKTYLEWIAAGSGYNSPPFRKYETHPLWLNHPKFKVVPGEAQFGHTASWPSPSNSNSYAVNKSRILPRMVASVIRDGETPENAMEKAARDIEKLILTRTTRGKK